MSSRPQPPMIRASRCWPRQGFQGARVRVDCLKGAPTEADAPFMHRIGSLWRSCWYMRRMVSLLSSASFSAEKPVANEDSSEAGRGHAPGLSSPAEPGCRYPVAGFLQASRFRAGNFAYCFTTHFLPASSQTLPAFSQSCLSSGAGRRCGVNLLAGSSPRLDSGVSPCGPAATRLHQFSDQCAAPRHKEGGSALPQHCHKPSLS
jgi:hypothetical protein